MQFLVTHWPNAAACGTVVRSDPQLSFRQGRSTNDKLLRTKCQANYKQLSISTSCTHLLNGWRDCNRQHVASLFQCIPFTTDAKLFQYIASLNISTSFSITVSRRNHSTASINASVCQEIEVLIMYFQVFSFRRFSRELRNTAFLTAACSIFRHYPGLGPSVRIHDSRDLTLIQ
jgi:hypothetical protein